MAERKGQGGVLGEVPSVLSRRRRDDVQDARDREIRVLLEAAPYKLGGLP